VLKALEKIINMVWFKIQTSATAQTRSVAARTNPDNPNPNHTNTNLNLTDMLCRDMLCLARTKMPIVNYCHLPL